ncbi:hypothetical protein [Kribbella sp. NPDC006257]|uniref:hypothetical protein n=1 Tax=Kribbella sp. NPDC006257 TaxID=3156738 RepID=UPI00339DDD19
MYDVVVLVEQELSVRDAEELVQLYASSQEQVKYHVIIPCEDAEAQVEASLSGFAGTEFYGIAAERYSVASDKAAARAPHDAQRAVDAQAPAALDRSLERLHALDQQADGLITRRSPVDELVDRIKQVNGQEVVILTRPHVVAELLHLDWSARARRHLDVPVLHLLEASPTS